MTFDKSELRELLEEATVDCYDEYEQFWGLYTMIDERVPFPFLATVVGKNVSVLGLDGEHSGLFGGIHARVRRGDKEYVASLTSLNVENANAKVAKWLAVYGYWARADASNFLESCLFEFNHHFWSEHLLFQCE